MKTNDNKDIIEKICDKLSKNEMSVLVGTGFSKNANPEIPLWDELLIDMVKELYQPEWIDWKLKTNNTSAYDFLKFKLREIDYLELVEKYIKFKGMRESITYYIENKLCPLDKDPKNDLETHKKLIGCNWNNIYTTNYDTFLERAANKSGIIDYEFITHSKDLSIRPQHRIIKLHGSLRESDQNKFGFDNDLSSHYVISKSDYDTYTEKHLAFTNLMRIALLQESFCLIGFSGSDPNFLAWIEWVRDILKDSEDKKVYFIDVNSKECSKERKLFFSNHQIEYVSLKNIFGKQTRKELINNFLDTIIVSQNPTKRYFSLWQELTKQPIFSSSFNEIYENIESNNKYYKIPNHSVYSSAEHFLRYNRNNLINSIKDNQVESIDVFGLISLIQRNSYYNLSAMFPTEELNILKKNFNEIEFKNLKEKHLYKWQNFALTLLRDYRYNMNEEKFNNFFNKLSSIENKTSDFYNEVYFEKLLFLANKLDYVKLIKTLDRWVLTDKSSAWAYIRKAYFYNLLNIPKYQKQITKLINQAIKRTDIEQEKLWFYEIFSLYQFSENFRRDEVVTAKINDYKHKGYYSIDETMKTLTSRKEKKDIKPPEANRYRITHSIGSSEDEVPWDCVRFIEFLNCFGIPLVSNIKFPVTLFDSIKWFDIAVDVLEGMPREVLFISFQYSGNDMSENFFRTIVQRIVFNKKISNEVKTEIFLNYCDSFFYYFNELGVYKSTFLFAISELVACLLYDKWKTFINKLWKLSKETSKILHKKFYSTVWGLSDIIPKFLPYIEDNDLLNEMIVTFFEYSHFVDGDDQERTALSYFEMILFHNPFFNAIPSCIEEIERYVQSLLEKESLSEKELIKIHYYRSKLSQSLDKLICDKIKKTDLSKALIFHWQLLLELTDSDADMDNRIREYILNNDDIIFSTGINENSGRSGGGWYFKISDTFKTDDVKEYLDWSKDQILSIFDKLKESFIKLKDYKSKHQKTFFIFNDEVILNDMVKFLCINKSYLMDTENFKKLSDEIEKKYFAEVGTESIYQGLLSDNDNQLQRSIVELLKQFKKNPQNEDDISWITLLMKIIRKDSIKLELAIEYFSFILTDIIKNQEWAKKYSQFYIDILRNYYKDIPAELDRIFIEYYLIKAAKVLKDWKIDDQIIDKWLEIKEESVFLKIRNMK